MPSLHVGSLGEYIREQRRSAQYSLRQLADAAGVSNPYLSQIERGLRKPSAEILQQIARALRISAETLYVRAGILDSGSGGGIEVSTAILNDPVITDRQKRVLIEIYESFRRESLAARPASEKSEGDRLGAGGPGADPTAPRRVGVGRSAEQRRDGAVGAPAEQRQPGRSARPRQRKPADDRAPASAT